MSEKWYEERRIQAWSLAQEGWTQSAIAERLGVTQSAVSKWLNRARMAGSIDALRTRPRTGRPPRLSAEQSRSIPDILARGPKAFGLPGHEWTIETVARAIRVTFGVTYHPSHISRLLRRLKLDRSKYMRTTYYSEIGQPSA